MSPSPLDPVEDLAESTPFTDWVFLLDARGHIIDCNATLASLHEQTPDHLRGKDYFSLLSGSRREIRERAFNQVLQTGGYHQFEERHAGRVYAISIHALHLPGTPVRSALVYIRDVTRQRQVQNALQESERKYRTLFEASPDGITIQEGLTFVDCNQHVLEMLEISREEFVGKTPVDFAPVEQPNGHASGKRAQQLTMVALNEEPVRFTWLVQKASGDPLYLDVSLRLFQMENRSLLLGYCRDITRRVLTARALKESERKYRTLFESSLVAVAITDEAGRILEANAVFQAQFLETASQVPRETLLDLVVEGDVRDNLWAEITTTGQVQNWELELRARAGRIAWASLSAQRLQLQDAPGYLISVIDRTERKQLEEQLLLRQRMDNLATLVGGIAHDFNNILVGIIGNLSLIEADLDDIPPRLRKHVEESQTSCQRAADLIQQLQHFSSDPARESKGQEVSPAPVDLAVVAREVFSFLDHTSDKAIRKEVQIPSGQFYVAGSATSLSQVLMNLGTNAVQAIEARERGPRPIDFVRVRATTRPVREVPLQLEGSTSPPLLANSEIIDLSVEDTGTGVPPAIRDQIFVPFFTTKAKGARKGQGLGLAMVYHIVTQHFHGAISVETELGVGTTFHIFLPPAPTSTPSQSSENTPTTSKTTRTNPLTRKPAPMLSLASPSVSLSPKVSITSSAPATPTTILVVDDEVSIRKLLERGLTRHGYTVLLARDGTEALAIFARRASEIDLVILDLTMPGLSGATIAAKMHADKPDKPVLISSGHDCSEIKCDLPASVRGILQKPYTIPELLSRIHEILQPK